MDAFQYWKNKAIAVLFICVASFALFEVSFFQVICSSAHVNRFYVNLGVFLLTICMGIYAYMDGYLPLMKNTLPTYENCKGLTQILLACLIGMGFSFMIGLWPHWHWLTLMYLFIWSFGVVLQLLTLFSTSIQRVLFTGMYLVFMQRYLTSGSNQHGVL